MNKFKFSMFLVLSFIVLGFISGCNGINQISKEESDLYLSHSIEKMYKEDYSGALQDLEKVIESNYNIKEAYKGKAAIKYSLGDKKGALQDLEKLIDIYPEDNEIKELKTTLKNELETMDEFYYLGLGMKSFQNGDTEGALISINEGIKINPQNANLYSLRSLIQEKLGNNNEALNDINKAITLKDNDESNYSLRSVLKLKLGDRKGAINDLDKAIEIDPTNEEYRNMKKELIKG